MILSMKNKKNWACKRNDPKFSLMKSSNVLSVTSHPKSRKKVAGVACMYYDTIYIRKIKPRKGGFCLNLEV